MRRAGIYPNLDKPGALEVTRRLVSWLEEHGIAVLLPREVALLLGRPELGGEVPAWAHDAELLIVLGGDGTLLQAARAVAQAETPILGVNLGHLGFLTEVEVPQLWEVLPRIVAGDFEVEERMMLDTRVVRSGGEVARFLALNEVVVSKGVFARLIRLELLIGGRPVEEYWSDGLIIATPTGSTAYSLSAGGPIVSPQLEVLVITPICPHTLYSRSLVISQREQVRVRVWATHRELALTIDGQRGYRLEPGDELQVSKAQESARLVRQRGWSFYEVLRRKLKEGPKAGAAPAGNDEREQK